MVIYEQTTQQQDDLKKEQLPKSQLQKFYLTTFCQKMKKKNLICLFGSFCHQMVAVTMQKTSKVKTQFNLLPNVGKACVTHI